MARKAVTADTDTDELQAVVKARLAADIENPSDVIGAAVAGMITGGGAPLDPQVSALIANPASDTGAALDTATAALVGNPASETGAALSATTGAMAWTPVDGATPAENLTSLQAAVNAAAAADVALRVPPGVFHIAGGHVAVAGTVRIVGAGSAMTTIIQDTKATAIFKVSAADVVFSGITLAGAGLDVTGHPLFGANSFRRHTGIWATLIAHRLTLDDILFRDIVNGLSVGDFWPGEVATYSSAGLIGLRVTNVRADNVWVGVGGGPVIDPYVVGVTGDYTFVTGTPTNGDTGSPPHLVYFSSDTAHPSKGGLFDKITGADVANTGGVLKVKHNTGFKVGEVVARNTQGILEMQECYDFEVGSLVSTGDAYPPSGTYGSASFVKCERGRVASAHFDHAASDHSSAIWTNSECVDLSFDNVFVRTNRLTSGVAGAVMALRIAGTGNKVNSPVIRSAGAAMWCGIALVGNGNDVNNPNVTGAFQRAIAGPGTVGIVSYDPALILPSRYVVGSSTFNLTAATSKPILRDRSIGQAVNPGATDNIDIVGRVVLAHTDDAKLWQTIGLEGVGFGTWTVTGGGARYAGGSVRAIAVVDAKLADATVSVVINALPNGVEGIVIRGVDANNYIAAIPFAGASDYRVQIMKRVAGTQTSLTTSTTVAAVDDELSITASGTTITAALNGVDVASTTITDFETATLAGLIGITSGQVFSVSSFTVA